MIYTILDLYCGAGGAARGYAEAGFEVVGVDINPQPRYPFTFIQADALTFLSDVLTGKEDGRPFRTLHAIHASPPCQRYSVMSNCQPGLAEKYPDLIEPTRFLMRRIGLPFVIENVPGAPLREAVTLCGSHFDLRAWWPQKQAWYGLERHRRFETWPFRVPSPGLCNHELTPLPIYGHNPGGNRADLRGRGFMAAAREVMGGVDWMTRDELSESIPPAYSRYIGEHLMAYLNRKEAA